MPEFLTLIPPGDALDIFLSNLTIQTIPEEIETTRALGRVITSPVYAPHPLPDFPRTTVDGFAVRAMDTFGASENLPTYLNLIGEVPMGGRPNFIVGPGETALIHTGGMVPEGADAVVMVENTQQAREKEVETLRAVAVRENIINIGEDVKQGQEVIPVGTRIRAAEIGGLMALGITRIMVARRPKVGIISSGDEVIPPHQVPNPGQVRDVNAYTLGALVETTGGEPVHYGIIPDTLDSMLVAATEAKAACELVVITAGSSASTRDLTAVVIDQLGEPGVLVHGVNVRPGKPTILAVCDQTAMVGLPGNPVSALVIKMQLGEIQSRPSGKVSARLAINLSSQTGREDWVPVQLVRKAEMLEAVPIFGRSNLIFTLARADGLIRIPPDATGLSAGQIVEVILQ